MSLPPLNDEHKRLISACGPSRTGSNAKKLCYQEASKSTAFPSTLNMVQVLTLIVVVFQPIVKLFQVHSLEEWLSKEPWLHMPSSMILAVVQLRNLLCLGFKTMFFLFFFCAQCLKQAVCDSP